MEAHIDPTRRHDFVLLFDVKDGNPNGDPDAGNLPRVDPETMQGLVSDVCLKRKVRDYVSTARPDEARFKIYVEHRGVLNAQHRRAYVARGHEPTGKPTAEVQRDVRSWMCEEFFDIRTFGAVMSMGVNCGQVRGPVQVTFARSVDPVVPMDLAITRVAVTREDHAIRFVEGDEEGEGTTTGKETEMGRKALIPYGLYRTQGFFNPHLARDTGFDDKDFSVLWEALERMWDLDRSASRGMMACRGLYVFSHDTALGDAPAHRLFDLVSVQTCGGIDVPRDFSDYAVTVIDEIPDGVQLSRLVE